MKGPVVTNPDALKKKPDLGGFTVEAVLSTLVDQVADLRKELNKAKKDIATLQAATKSQGTAISDLGKKLNAQAAKAAAQTKTQDAKIAALENKAATVAPHVHDYLFANVQAFPVHFEGGSASSVSVENQFLQTKPPK